MNLSPLFKGICGGVSGLSRIRRFAVWLRGKRSHLCCACLQKARMFEKCLGKRRGLGENRTPRRGRFPLFFLTFG